MSRRRRWAEDDVAGLERWLGVVLPAEFRQYPRWSPAARAAAPPARSLGFSAPRIATFSQVPRS